MKKYYLHVTNGEKTFVDITGVSLQDDKAAMAFGRIIADDLAIDAAYDEYYVDVWDEEDNNVGRVYVLERH